MSYGVIGSLMSPGMSGGDPSAATTAACWSTGSPPRIAFRSLRSRRVRIDPKVASVLGGSQIVVDEERQVPQPFCQLGGQTRDDLRLDARRHRGDRGKEIRDVVADEVRGGGGCRDLAGAERGTVVSDPPDTSAAIPEPRSESEQRKQCDRDRTSFGAGSAGATSLSRIGSWQSSKHSRVCRPLGSRDGG